MHTMHPNEDGENPCNHEVVNGDDDLIQKVQFCFIPVYKIAHHTN